MVAGRSLERLRDASLIQISYHATAPRLVVQILRIGKPQTLRPDAQRQDRSKSPRQRPRNRQPPAPFGYEQYHGCRGWRKIVRRCRSFEHDSKETPGDGSQCKPLPPCNASPEKQRHREQRPQEKTPILL